MPAPLPLQSAPPLVPQTPHCPKCGAQMHLSHIEPCRYSNLHLWCYACQCGGEVEQFVAEQDKG